MAARSDQEVALISIHPRWAEAILAGTKRVELRRQIPAHPVRFLVIYATAPVSQVVGWAEVTEVDSGSPSAIWHRWNSEASVPRSTFRKYFSGARTGHAIVLGHVHELDRPIDLRDVGVERPPQSFQYMNGNAALVPGLSELVRS